MRFLGFLGVLGATIACVSLAVGVRVELDRTLETGMMLTSLYDRLVYYTRENSWFEVIPDEPLDDRSTWKRTRRQGVQLARMFVSEDSRPLLRPPYGTDGHMTIDHRMIAQVVFATRNTRERFSNWLHVMRFLSPHVGGLKMPKCHRHKWTSTLPANGNGKPRGWIDCEVVVDGNQCDGYWRIHGPRWVKFRERVIDFWLTIDDSLAATEANGVVPRMWGNRSDVMRFLRRYNLCVLPHGDVNFFLARPGDGCDKGDSTTRAGRFGKKPHEMVGSR